MTVHPLPNVQGRPARLQPGPSLSGTEAEQFAELVASAAPEHFRPCDLPTLEALAQAIVVSRTLSLALAEHGAVDGDGRVSPIVRNLRAQHALIASLSTRLRFTPSSRAQRTTANRTANAAPSVLDIYERAT